MALLDKIRGANSEDNLEVDFSDEYPGEELEKDPAPGKPARSERADKPKPAARRVSATVKKQLADELEAYLLLGAGAWQMRDQHCGETLEKQAQQISVRMAAILGRNAQIVEWLHTSGMVGDWLQLYLAIKPVVDAIRDHHITKTVSNDDGADPYSIDYPAYRPA